MIEAGRDRLGEIFDIVIEVMPEIRFPFALVGSAGTNKLQLIAPDAEGKIFTATATLRGDGTVSSIAIDRQEK